MRPRPLRSLVVGAHCSLRAGARVDRMLRRRVRRHPIQAEGRRHGRHSRPAIFPHWIHRMQYKCGACHDEPSRWGRRKRSHDGHDRRRASRAASVTTARWRSSRVSTRARAVITDDMRLGRRRPQRWPRSWCARRPIRRQRRSAGTPAEAKSTKAPAAPARGPLPVEAPTPSTSSGAIFSRRCASSGSNHGGMSSGSRGGPERSASRSTASSGALRPRAARRRRAEPNRDRNRDHQQRRNFVIDPGFLTGTSPSAPSSQQGRQQALAASSSQSGTLTNYSFDGNFLPGALTTRICSR